ncbi:MAG: polyprenyl synthetase family protein [Parachlamydiaceae bacterium]|nr:polyprenyl synthetase family protein [Parachlamydiaceae bacterium]
MESTDAMLSRYQQRFEEKIKHSVQHFPDCGPLSKACEYALLNGGKRFRPSLVLMFADALGHGADVTGAALAIEYFHIASLVVDDLPSMDDDDLRRSKPSTHKVYGEATALLVSYALIAVGYSNIAISARAVKDAQHLIKSDSNLLGMLALENATYNTGLMGATGGQFLDIFPPNLDLLTLRDVIHKKTVSLFEIAFVFGWLFGGGNPEVLNVVKRAASHFGMAFQIVDDLDDMIQDAKNERKVNMAIVFGLEAAQQMLREEITGYLAALKELNLESKALLGIARWLEGQVFN